MPPFIKGLYKNMVSNLICHRIMTPKSQVVC